MNPILKNSGRQRHLKRLTEYVETKRGDNNRSDRNAPSSDLDALEENQHQDAKERRVPGNETVDDVSTDWTHSHCRHAH